MNTSRTLSILLRITIATLLASVTLGVAHAEKPIVRWERIEGIKPNPLGQMLVNGINPVAFPWSVSRGRASLNVENGRVQFHVEGLSMGASPSPIALIGTTGVVTMVKGTVMCHEFGGDVADTEGVELSPDGDAFFTGRLSLIPNCERTKLVFLLRVAEVVPGGPPITNLWLAHGAARRIQ